MELSGILLFIIGFVLGGAAVWFLRQKEVESIKKSQEQVRNAFGDLSNEALIENQKKFLELAEDKFSSLLGKSDEQLGKKKELIDSTLKEMKIDLKSLSENTVALKSQMEESRKSVGELSDTTSQLRQILSSSQARGQWGERMVKDILDFIGLVEGINYSKQAQVSEGTERPDFTFFLPDDKSLNMDVKFPLSHYLKYLDAKGAVSWLKSKGIKENDIIIYGSAEEIKGGVKVNSNYDHRIAMSFLILGGVSQKPIEVSGCKSILTSYPNFLKQMNGIGLDIRGNG